MATAGGGFKLVGGCQWLQTIIGRGFHSTDLLKQKSSSESKTAEGVWQNFFFPPLAGPLSNNPTWIPNWVPLQMALYSPALRARIAMNGGTNAANRAAFVAAAKQEAATNGVWAKFRVNGYTVVVQLALVPAYLPTVPR
jgi:hypothetical protein